MIIHELQVMDDHIHCFIELPPSLSISKAFQLLKGKSSRILRRNFRIPNRFENVWSKGGGDVIIILMSRALIERYLYYVN